MWNAKVITRMISSIVMCMHFRSIFLNLEDNNTLSIHFNSYPNIGLDIYKNTIQRKLFVSHIATLYAESCCFSIQYRRVVGNESSSKLILQTYMSMKLIQYEYLDRYRLIYKCKTHCHRVIYQIIVGYFPVELRYPYPIMLLRMILQLQLHF